MAFSSTVTLHYPDEGSPVSGVADPWHFGVNPDPRIHASDKWMDSDPNADPDADPDPANFVIDNQN